MQNGDPKFGGLFGAFSIIFSYLKPYKTKLALISITGFLAAILGALVPFMTGRLIDSIVKPYEIQAFGLTLQAFLVILIGWAIIELVSSICNWYITRSSLKISTKLWGSYIIESFSNLIRLPISFHKTHKIGEIRGAINKTAHELDALVGNVILNLTPQFLSIFISIGLAIFINPILTLVLVVGISIYITVLTIVVRPLAGMQIEFFREWRKMFGNIDDSLDNIRQIKDSASENYEAANLAGISKPVIEKRYKMASVWQDMSFYQQFVILATRLFIFAISIYLILKNDMTVGELLAFNGYAQMLFGPFVVLGTQWQFVQNGLIDIKENEKILSAPKENYSPEDSTPFDIKGTIHFKNVGFYYDSHRPILKNLSFEINPGEMVALVGESGVGKSTLIDLISAYYFPSEGDILIDGRSIRKIDLNSLRSQIGVVSQDIALFNDTIKKNISYGSFNASDTEISYAAQKSHALDFIEKFPEKWEQKVGSRGIKLSGGQKQRIAIARAILRNPKILILDEPTSALDAKSENIVKESLKEVMKGRTTIIVAHRLSTVRNADKIVVLKDGSIAEIGKHEDLLRLEGGEYKRLHDLQIGLS